MESAVKTFTIPEIDCLRLQRAVEIYREIEELTDGLSMDELAADRIRLLAVMRLLDTMSTNLARVSVRCKLASLNWSAIVGIKAHLTKVKVLPDMEKFGHMLQHILPDMMHGVQETLQQCVPMHDDRLVKHKTCDIHTLPSTDCNQAFTSLFPRKDSTKQREQLWVTSTHRLFKSTDPAYERLRTEIETWYRRLPEKHRRALHGRLISNDDSTNMGAFYELLFHEYCYRRGFGIEIEPSVSIYHPDFLIDSPSGAFYAEVLGVWSEVDATESKCMVNGLLQALDAFPSNHLVSVEFHTMPKQISISDIVNRVRDWLSELSSTCTQPHYLQITETDINCTISAVARNKIAASGNVYAWSVPDMEMDESIRAVERARRKSLKFATMTKLPIVLVVCGRDNVAWDELTLCQELFGHVEITTHYSGSRSVRLKQHGWGLSPNQNRSISAIMFVTRNWDRGRMGYSRKVIHNPWARFPLSAAVFNDLPQLVPSVEAPTELLEWQFP